MMSRVKSRVLLLGLVVLSLLVAAGLFVGCSGEDEPGEWSLVVEPEGPVELTAGVRESVASTVTVWNEGEGSAGVLVSTDAEWLQTSVGSLLVSSGGGEDLTIEGSCGAEEETRTGQVSLGSGDRPAEVVIDVVLTCEAAAMGVLVIELEGLQEGFEAEVQVVGSGGFMETLVGEGQLVLGELSPGTYDVIPGLVGDEVFFLPEEESIAADVVANEETTVVVEYEVVSSTVQASSTGLPVGAPTPRLSLILEGGEEFEFPPEGVLDAVVPGDHVVTGRDVDHNGTIYAATPQEITVVSDVSVQAVVEYAPE